MLNMELDNDCIILDKVSELCKFKIYKNTEHIIDELNKYIKV